MHACDVVGIDVAPCPDLRPETPQGLSPLSYSGHTPSPLVLVFDQGEALPRKPMDLPRFVTSMQLVVRSLGCLPPWDVACMESPRTSGCSPLVLSNRRAFFPLPKQRSFQSAEHRSTNLQSPSGSATFAARDLPHSLFAIRLICPRRSLDSLSDVCFGPEGHRKRRTIR